MKTRVVLLALLLPGGLWAQEGLHLIQAVQARWNRVTDYSVQVTIRSEIPLIKSFPVNATIYFKQKDQFLMIAKGIAILPKQPFHELPVFLSRQEAYTALITGKETIAGALCTRLTVLPVSDTGDLVLLKLWVDTAKDLLLRSQITTRSNGTITAQYVYGRQAAFGLPDQLLFTVDVKKFKIPKGLAADINRTSDAERQTPKNGTISLLLADYLINKGLSDGLFKK